MAARDFRALIPRADVIAERLPRASAVVVGLLAVLVGLLLMVRPLTALTALALLIAAACVVTGVGELVLPRCAGRLATALALGWVLTGVLVVVQMGSAIDLLPRFVAAALVIGGAIRAAGVRAGTLDDRVIAGMLAAAEIVLGVVAWLWPDVTLLVVAVLFGIRTVTLGAGLLWAARPSQRAIPATPATPATPGTPGTPAAPAAPAAPATLARVGRVVAAGLALALAIAVAVVSAHLRASSPRTEDFYSAPDSVPAESGVLLRAEPFARGDIPAEARAWRILYSTVDAHGSAALSSGLVLVPRDAPAGPLPVVAWAHGTTGFATGCAPTLLPEPLAAGALPALPQLLAEGWALVATDYTGLGTAGPHPYLIGHGEGTSVLDAVRAARQLPDIDLDDRTVVWGHSQGGHAALWTGVLAPGYAPDANVVGVAAMAPAADGPGLVRHLPNVAGGTVFGSYVIAAYTAIYPDVNVDHYIIPAARTLVRDMSTRCLAEPGVLVSVLSAMSIDRDRPIFARDPLDGPFGDRLRENVPAGELTVPLLLAQGGADSLITPDVQRAYASDRCAAGWNIDYRIYHGRDHLGVVAADSPLVPELITWTRARFADRPQIPNCPG
ncbi:lipase family protein [Nocardia shimofusensis]|uniref:lipase family protein n=1 Tax=Nocardia shimofusensis TaxID=228596 RepID=UPI000836085B|nr:lipase family protein [Nocardia shimofusensis]